MHSVPGAQIHLIFRLRFHWHKNQTSQKSFPSFSLPIWHNTALPTAPRESSNGSWRTTSQLSATMKAAISACLITGFTQASLCFKGSFNKCEVKLERRKKLNRTIVCYRWLKWRIVGFKRKLLVIAESLLSLWCCTHTYMNQHWYGHACLIHVPCLFLKNILEKNNNNNKMVFIYSSLSCAVLQNSSDVVRSLYMAEGSGKPAESKTFLWKIKPSFILKLEFLLSSHN